MFPADLNSDSIRAWAVQVKADLGLSTFDVWLHGGTGAIELFGLVVPPNLRKAGVGGRAVQAVCDLADRHGKMVILTPAERSPRTGTTSRSRLIRFYRRFDFVLNRGRNRDFRFRAMMLRRPR